MLLYFNYTDGDEYYYSIQKEKKNDDDRNNRRGTKYALTPVTIEEIKEYEANLEEAAAVRLINMDTDKIEELNLCRNGCFAPIAQLQHDDTSSHYHHPPPNFIQDFF